VVDPRISNLAKLVVKYSTEIKDGDEVVIFSRPVAIPLAREIFREALRAGGYPHLILSDDVSEEIFFKEASEKQLKHVSPIRKAIVEKATVLISIYSELNLRMLNTINPERLKLAAAARTEIVRILREREAKGELRWVLVPYPTPSMAQEAGMSTIDFEDFVYKACYADSEDPIAAWKKMHETQKKYVEFLNKVKEIHIVGPDTDLVLSVEGRKWINADGKKNLPDGEVFTSPVEDSANGVIKFTYPVLHQGVEMKNVRLKFKEGEVVEAEASEGKEFLRKILETDEGAKRLGEFAFGTNYNIRRFTRQILFDEKIGGTIHLAIGMGFPEAGGKNFSVIHVDMIKDMREGKVYADGELIYEKGKFLI